MNGLSEIDIDAPIDVVWDAVTSPEAMLQWQPDMRELTCLERDSEGRPWLLFAVLDTVIRRAEVELRMTYQDGYRLTWEMEKGNVPRFTGGWTLTELAAARTTAVYEVEIDFGRMGRLIRGPMAGMVKGAASSMPGKLKAYVESR